MKKIIRWVFAHTEGILMALFTVLLVTDVLLGIVARYIRFEVVFATELGKYLFIWLCAIGISAAAKDNQHIRLDYFAEKLHLPNQVTWLVSQSLFLIFSLFFAYWSLQLTLMQYSMQKSAMGFQFPMYVFTAALPFGFTLTAIRLILNIVRSIQHGPQNDPLIPKNR